MGVLDDLILNTRTRFPTALVSIGGRSMQIANVSGAITLAQTFGQPVSGGTIRVRKSPQTIKIGMTCTIRWGYNGVTIPAFTGFVTNVQRDSYPNVWLIQVKDNLWKADFPFQVEEVNLLNNLTARSVVTKLLKDYGGLNKLSIDPLRASGSAWAGNEWIMGTLTPILFRGQSPLQAAQSICAVLGYWMYCDPGGTIRTIKMSGAPSSRAKRVFTRGDDLLINGAPSLQQQVESIYNRVVVRGANTGVEGAQISDTWQVNHTLLPSGIYREMQYSSPFIEYVNESQAGAASASGVAKRLIVEHGRDPNVIRARIKADPRLAVGTTVGIYDPAIGYGSATNFFIYSLQWTFGGGAFDCQMTLDGGTGPGGYTTVPEPLAVIGYTLLRETLESGQITEVFLDGSASKSLTQGEIVDWAWSDNVDPQQTATGPTALFIYGPEVTTVTITLSVTDTTSKIGSASVEIDLVIGDENGAPQTLGISFAAGSVWYATPDAGATWNTDVSGGDAISTPPIGNNASEKGIFASGASGGTMLRSSLDFLITPGVAASELGGPIRFLWQNELNPMRVWAAVGDEVHRSVDTGATFELRGQPESGQNVNWIVESAANDDALDVLAGRHAYTSSDGGAAYQQVLEGPPGSVAKCFVSGFERHWVGFTGVAENGQALRSYEGQQVLFTADPPVLSIEALTMLVNEPTLIAIDDLGRIWSVDAMEGATATQIAVTGALPDYFPHQCIRDPTGTVVYIATNKALLKLLVPNATIYIMKTVAEGEQGHMVGYSQQAQTSKVEFVYVPNKIGVEAEDVWQHYRDGIWTNGPLPVAEYQWISIKVDPKNPNRWLILGFPPEMGVTDPVGLVGGRYEHTDGNSPLWMTLTAGQTWVQVDLLQGDQPDEGGAYVRLYGITFHETTNAWYVVGTVGLNGEAAWWFGSGTEGAGRWASTYRETHWIAAHGDDILVSSIGMPAGPFVLTAVGSIGRLENASNTITPVTYWIDPAIGYLQPFGPFDVRPLPFPQLYQADSRQDRPGLIHVEDYREFAPLSFTQPDGPDSIYVYPRGTLSGWNRVSCGVDFWFAGGTFDEAEGGLDGVTGFFYTPYEQELTRPPGYAMATAWHLRVGRAQRRVMIGYGLSISPGDYIFVAFDGALWSAISLPMTYTTPEGWLGPILRNSFDTPFDVIERPAPGEEPAAPEEPEEP